MKRTGRAAVLLLAAACLTATADGQERDEYKWHYQDNNPDRYESSEGFDRNEGRQRPRPDEPYYDYGRRYGLNDPEDDYDDYGNLRMYDDETYGLFDEADYPEWYDFEEDAGDLGEEYEWRAFGDFVEDPDYEDDDRPYPEPGDRSSGEETDYYRAFGRNVYRDAFDRGDDGFTYIDEYNDYDFGRSIDRAIAEWIESGAEEPDHWGDNTYYYEN